MSEYMVEFEVTQSDFDNDRFGEKLYLENSALFAAKNGHLTVGTILSAKSGFAAAFKFMRVYKAIFSHMPIKWHTDFVTLGQIAKRTQYSHEAIRLLANGQRGGGDFPKPVAIFGGKLNSNSIWNWPEVFNWMVANEKLENEYLYPTQNEIMLINGELAIKQPA